MSRSNDRSVQEAQRDLMLRIHTEGVEAAYAASLAVCRDTKAPAPARATASATLFRVAGYFAVKERDEKEPHEMTAAELQAAIDEATRRIQPASAARVTDRDGEGSSGGPGIFG